MVRLQAAKVVENRDECADGKELYEKKTGSRRDSPRMCRSGRDLSIKGALAPLELLFRLQNRNKKYCFCMSTCLAALQIFIKGRHKDTMK